MILESWWTGRSKINVYSKLLNIYVKFQVYECCEHLPNIFIPTSIRDFGFPNGMFGGRGGVVFFG